MQRNLTWSLFAAAVCLFALIYFFERKLPGSSERHQAKPVLPITTVAEIQSMEVTLSPSGVVRVEKTNGVWMLTEPRYPAKQVVLDTFATNLVDLRAFDRVPPHEVKLQGQKSFGLAPPKAIVSINSGSNTFELEIGGIAPITSNLYVRLPQSGEVILTGTGLLETLPRGTNDWRTRALFQLSARDFDHIEVKEGQRAFELGRGTNNIWQISKPVPARADQDRVLELLQTLRSVEALGFVADSPGADLERFRLQIPEVEVSFSADTNRLYAIDFGGSPTNQTNEVFAMLIAPGQTNIVLASRALAEYLKQPYKAYHDPRLVTIAPGALDRIVVHGREDFTLQRQPNSTWVLDDKTKMPIDPLLFSKFVTAAGSLRIVDIVKEVPTETDLKTFGFLPPVASYSFFQKLTNNTGITTNILFTDLTFGHPQSDTIYVRRSDENPIYQTQLAYLVELPKHAFELRDRKLWQFDTNALERILISSGTKTNSVSRTAAGWSKDDPILNAQIEEIAFRLSHLEAQEWVAKGSERLATFGINESNPILTLGLRDAKEDETYSLRFGRQTLRHDVYAAIRFAGDREPTIFEFPGDTYQLMLQSLPFPK